MTDTESRRDYWLGFLHTLIVEHENDPTPPAFMAHLLWLQALLTGQLECSASRIIWEAIPVIENYGSMELAQELRDLAEYTETPPGYSDLDADAVVIDPGQSLEFGMLRAANIARLPYYKHGTCQDWTPSDWLLALVGEVGELANYMKKIRRGDITAGDGIPQLRREVADIQTYLDLLAWSFGFNLAEITIEKWNEVSNRVGAPIMLSTRGPIQTEV